MKKKPLILILALVVFSAFLFFFTEQSGSAVEVLSANVNDSYDRVDDILDYIELNDEGDALCVFSSGEKLGVAYLNCVGENEYKYGTAVSYDHYYSKEGKYDISFIEAGDSDLRIKYAVTNENAEFDDSKKSLEYNIGANTFKLHLLSVEEKKCSGYMYYLNAAE